jgi:phospholipid/cholesterol/gamma-HCH transport system substrate-binding protein
LSGTVNDLLGGLTGGLGLPRAAPHLTREQRREWDARFGRYDSDLALFLAAPVVGQGAAR